MMEGGRRMRGSVRSEHYFCRTRAQQHRSIGRSTGRSIGRRDKRNSIARQPHHRYALTEA